MTGIILAGGKNSRIGKKKAFLEVGKKVIIERIMEVLKKIFSEIIIVTNSHQDFEIYGVGLVCDLMPENGSLGGLYSGLMSSKSEYNFVMACDMPFPNEQLIRHIIGDFNGFGAVTPKINGHYEPLFSLYSKDCCSVISNQIKQNNLKILDFFSHIKVKEIEESIIKRFDPNLYSFLNVNTDEDYKHVLQIKAVY